MCVVRRSRYSPSDVTNYNLKYRNVALANLSAEHLLMVYGNSGLQAVQSELQNLRRQGLIRVPMADAA